LARHNIARLALAFNALGATIFPGAQKGKHKRRAILGVDHSGDNFAECFARCIEQQSAWDYFSGSM